MNISNFTVRRPILTSMLSMMVLILGLFSFSRLPIDLMPDVSFPTLTVVTGYENTGPAEIEELITKPIEEILATMPAVESLQSTSREGQSVVRVSFVWGTNLNEAAADIRDGLDRIADRLPEEAEKPRLLKFDTTDFPIIVLGVGSDLDLFSLRKLIDQQIKYRIERLEGVAALNIAGGLERQIQVQLDPEKIKAARLTLEEINQALKTANVTLPAGRIEAGSTDIRIRVPGRYDNIEQIRNTIISKRLGTPIYLYQIADVTDTNARVERKAVVNGEPGVNLLIRKQSGYNTVDVAARVMEEVENIQKDFPQVQIVPVLNTGKYIQLAIDNVNDSLFYGAFLAFLVLLFFLRDLIPALLVTVAIPVSLLATFVMMYFAGYTINMMTLGGLALGVGMMLDNSIVVLESITRIREEENADLLRSVTHGTEEVFIGLLGGTGTNIVVFLPLMLAEGLAGELFGQLGATVSFALAASLIEASTIAPMLTYYLFKFKERRGIQVPTSQRAKGLSAKIANFNTNIQNRYKDLIRACLERPFLVVASVSATILFSAILAPIVGTEFMPKSDENEVRLEYEMKAGTRLERVEEKMKMVYEAVKENVPEMESNVINIGPTMIRPEAKSIGEMRIALVSGGERSRTTFEVADELRQRLESIPGGVIKVGASQDIMLQMMGGGGAIEIEVRGYDLAILQRLTEQLSGAMDTIPEITNLKTSAKDGEPEILLVVDRGRAADAGISVAQIARTLETALAGSTVTYFRDSGYEYRVQLKFQNSEQMTIDDILELTILNQVGQQIAIRGLVHTKPSTGAVEIERHGQQRVMMVSADFTDSDLGTVVTKIQDKIGAIPMPPGFTLVIGGEFEQQQAAFRDLTTVLILAIIMVYVVLACLFESLIDPLVLMFAVPFVTIGIVVAVIVTGTSFNIMSGIGVILLVGLVVNNAILLVERAHQLRHDEHMPMKEALAEAGRQRLRPILMTAFTTGLGIVPMAFAQGEGATIQRAMAISIIGGLISSTLITLVIIPTLYMVFHRREIKLEPHA